MDTRTNPAGRIRGKSLPIEKALRDACDRLGCAYDVEAALAKIDDMKSRLEEAERMVRVARDIIPPPVSGVDMVDKFKANAFNVLREALYRLPEVAEGSLS